MKTVEIQTQKAGVFTTACTVLRNDVESVLVQAGVTHCQQVGETLEQLIHHCRQYGSPDIVVVDLSQQSAETDVEQLVSVCRPDTKILAVGTVDSVGYYRTLLEKGVREYLTMPVDKGSLANCIANMMTGAVLPAQVQRSGQRIAVASTKGGAGCTAIACNLAWALSQQKRNSVALADLDFVSGDADLCLDVSASNQLIEMLQFPERLEPLVYERGGVQVADNFRLFTGYSQSLEQEFWPNLNAFEAVSQFCQMHAKYLIWDIPSFSLRDHVGYQAFQTADIRIVVVEPTLASLRHTNQLLERLEQVPGQRTLLVLNYTKPEKTSLIGVDDVTQALGQQPDLVIPFSPEKMLPAETLGEMAVAGKGKLAAQLQALAKLIDGEPVSRSSGLRKWFGRA